MTSSSGTVADEFRSLFAAFDKDNNGCIDAEELRTTMQAVGLELSDNDVEEMMKAAGVSKGDRIYYEGNSGRVVILSVTLCSQFSSIG